MRANLSYREARQAASSAAQLPGLIRNSARVITSSRLQVVTTDPADNIFVACSDAARADYLITGNQRHFPKFWENTKIITSREFLTVITPHLLD